MYICIGNSEEALIEPFFASHQHSIEALIIMFIIFIKTGLNCAVSLDLILVLRRSSHVYISELDVIYSFF